MQIHLKWRMTGCGLVKLCMLQNYLLHFPNHYNLPNRPRHYPPNWPFYALMLLQSEQNGGFKKYPMTVLERSKRILTQPVHICTCFFCVMFQYYLTIYVQPSLLGLYTIFPYQIPFWNEILHQGLLYPLGSSHSLPHSLHYEYISVYLVTLAHDKQN